MSIQLLLLSLLSLSCAWTSLALHSDQHVGSTSMDSTHYDRRTFQEQCPTQRELPRASFWAAARSLASPANATSVTQLIPFRRQLILNTGDERLVTRAVAAVPNANQSTVLGIDQAAVDIVVDTQVRDPAEHCWTTLSSFRFRAI